MPNSWAIFLNVVYNILNGVLFAAVKNEIYIIFSKTDGTGRHHVK